MRKSDDDDSAAGMGMHRPPMPVPSPRHMLEQIVTVTDRLWVGPDGALMVDKCSADDLVRQFGSPQFVLVEATLRENFKRMRNAFSAEWPGEVAILHSIKANANIAVRSVAHAEGCGSDCSSLGELAIAEFGGTSSRLTTLNGSNKQEEEVKRATAMGAVVVIDSVEEVSGIAAWAQEIGRTARVMIRLRPFDPRFFEDFQSDGYPQSGGYADTIGRKKWGLSPASARAAMAEIGSRPALLLEGFHAHIGRFSRSVDLFAHNLGFAAGIVADLSRATGYWPSILDIGGGWPRDRDPEARSREPNPVTIERYAAAACNSFEQAFEPLALPFPELWIESGRYALGNAGVLLATVGVVKRDADRTWVNIDASGELMVLVQNFGAMNHVTVATDMERPLSMHADIVGPTCVAALFAKQCPLPAVRKGDLVAVLDAGAYAEAQASQFNSIPRPATVLVNGEHADLIRRRETLEDLLAPQLVPTRLRRTGGD